MDKHFVEYGDKYWAFAIDYNDNTIGFFTDERDDDYELHGQELYHCIKEQLL